MSMCYWMIEGVGVAVDKVYPHLDNEKVTRMLHKQFPDDEGIAEIMNSGRYGDMNMNPCVYSDCGVNLIDFFHGKGFDGGLGDLLCHCDDTDSLTFCDDGEGCEYFYYPPSMPWHRTDTEPDSIEEVHRRIIKAVQKLTNLSDAEIVAMINDDLYEVGCG